jgi:hypothetical protein
MVKLIFPFSLKILSIMVRYILIFQLGKTNILFAIFHSRNVEYINFNKFQLQFYFDY